MRKLKNLKLSPAMTLDTSDPPEVSINIVLNKCPELFRLNNLDFGGKAKVETARAKHIVHVGFQKPVTSFTGQILLC